MIKVKITDEALDQIGKLPIVIQGRVHKIISRLKLWPEVSGAKPLRGKLKGHYRLRTGDYRVRFYVKEEMVVIYRVGNRRDVYED